MQLVRDIRAENVCRGKSSAVPVNCLIVEDDESDAILSLEAVGSVGGVSAMLARSGDEAMALLKEAAEGFRPPFDIVFVDLKLAGSDAQGIEVIRRIRQRFPHTHCIIVSGTMTPADFDALRGTYVGIVSKPLHHDNLQEIISKHHLREPV